MKPAFIVIIIAPGPHFLQLKVVDTGKSADLDRTPLLTMRFPSLLSSMVRPLFPSFIGTTGECAVVVGPRRSMGAGGVAMKRNGL